MVRCVMLRIDPAMSTKKPSTANVPVDQCTVFQIITSNAGVLDFTLGRLRALCHREKDPTVAAQIQDLIVQYSAGLIAVGFHRGRPTFIRATKNP